jgi:hypothetical protein
VDGADEFGEGCGGECGGDATAEEAGGQGEMRQLQVLSCRLLIAVAKVFSTDTLQPAFNFFSA